MLTPRLYLLSQLRIQQQPDGGAQAISFTPGPPALLLAYLALHGTRGRLVPRSRLAGTLWPEIPEFRARRNLTETLYRLRRLLGDLSEGWLRAGEETLSLGDIWVDVDEFRTLAASPEMPDLRAALALYCGDLLEDLDAEWLLGPRAELREKHLSLLERACADLTHSGDLPQALTFAHRRALADPLNEEAHRVAMRLYARLGRHAAALQQYDGLTRLLAAELNIEPLSETRALAAAIRSEAASQLAPAAPRPFVGRRRERAALLQRVEQVLAGRGRAATLESEPGMGKTRLLEEVAAGAAWRGMTVVWGRAQELTAPRPYTPLAEALHAALAGPRADQLRALLPLPTAAALGRLIPALHVGPPRRPSPGPGEAAGTDLPDLSAAFVEGLLALATLAPHLFIFDDVQWAEVGFWEALRLLWPRLAGRPLLLLLSYRSRDLRANPPGWAALCDLDLHSPPLKIALPGLSPQECAELAAELGHPLDGEAAQALQRRTGGNPLFVREVLLGEQGERLTYPDLLERRLASLSPASRAALEAGAVLGREFTHGAWQALAGASLPAAIPRLLADRFIEETEQGYAFEHDLTREHVYRAIAPERLPDLHRRAGECQQRERAEPAVLAWHFERGEQWPQAVRYHREAGERAGQAFAYAAGLEHIDHALQLSARLSDPRPERLLLLYRRTRLIGKTRPEGEWEAAQREFAQAAAEADDASMLLKAALNQLENPALRGDWPETRETAEHAIALARQAGDTGAEAKAHNLLGWLLVDSLRRPADGLPHLQRAVELAGRPENEPGLLAWCLENMATAQLLLGRCRAARENFQRVLAISRDDPRLAFPHIGALLTLGLTEMHLARWQAARERVAQARQWLPRIGNPPGHARLVLTHAAHLSASMGQVAEAREALAFLLALHGESSQPGDSPPWKAALARAAEVCVLLGDLDEAERLLADLAGWAETAPPGSAVIYTLAAQGRLHLARNRPGEALPPLARAVHVWQESLQSVDVTPVLLHALAAWRAGDAPSARASLQLAESTLIGTDVARHDVELAFARFQITADPGHLVAAREELRRQADLFTDARLRADFLREVSLHREIEARWQTLHPPPAPVAAWLARADVPLGRPLTEPDRLEVRWTPDAGEADMEILRSGGKAALRRQRIRRLLEEARTQGAAPTDADLARALGVTERTIERDMAVLRARGEKVATRRRKG